jgi:glutamine synthetase
VFINRAIYDFIIYFSKLDTETGPGVLETALAYTSALRMADNAILYKYTAKSVGMKYGIIPSFMAKPWNGVSSVLIISDGVQSEFFILCLSCRGLVGKHRT